MGATNSTTNLQLPQFIGTDKPSWLGDFNGAMLKVDNFAGKAESDIGTVTATANAAKATAEAAEAAVGALETTVEQHTTEISDAMADIASIEADITAINNKIIDIPTIKTLDFFRVVSNTSSVRDAKLIFNWSNSASYEVTSCIATPTPARFSKYILENLSYIGYCKGRLSTIIPVGTASAGALFSVVPACEAVCVSNNTLASITVFVGFDSSTQATLFFAAVDGNSDFFSTPTLTLTFYGTTSAFTLSEKPFVPAN